jgi:hypothetical protein
MNPYEEAWIILWKLAETKEAGFQFGSPGEEAV